MENVLIIESKVARISLLIFLCNKALIITDGYLYKKNNERNNTVFKVTLTPPSSKARKYVLVNMSNRKIRHINNEFLFSAK